MNQSTSDLCDAHASKLQVVAPVFKNYGGQQFFSGTITTLKVFEDYMPLRTILDEPGAGRVLVVDGGGSIGCALFGDRLAGIGLQNNWAGVVIYGAIRDVDGLASIMFGVQALASSPLRGSSNTGGQRDVPVQFGGVTFEPGAWLAADLDGIIVAATPLSISENI